MTPTYPCSSGRTPKRSGFTIIEMLVVIAIISLAFGCFLAFMSGSSNFTAGAYNILGVFQQAQSIAVTRSTYVWVGIFEEDPTAITTPATAGKGQLVISAVASVDGTNLLSEESGATVLPSTALTQVLPLMKIPGVHVQTGLGTGNISSLPATTSEINPALAPSANSYIFYYPLSGTSRYKFSQIVQFDPQGDAAVIYGSPVQLLQLGLIPAVGNTPLTTSKNVLAIQISGIGGKATVYRP